MLFPIYFIIINQFFHAISVQISTGFPRMAVVSHPKTRDSTPPQKKCVVIFGLGIVKNDPPSWIHYCRSQPTKTITFQQPEQRIQRMWHLRSVGGWIFPWIFLKLHSQMKNQFPKEYFSFFQLKSRFNLWHRSWNQQCFSTNSSYQTHIKKTPAVSKALFKTIAKNGLWLFYRSIFPYTRDLPLHSCVARQNDFFEQKGWIRNVAKNANIRNMVNSLCSKPIPKGVTSQWLYCSWWCTILRYSEVKGCIIDMAT